MSFKKWISFPKSEGEHSRQAHADTPSGTYEREMGKEGFFGPSVQFHHRHPPTGWTSFEGELKPHAFDLNLLPSDPASPWTAAPFLHNGDLQLRLWRCDKKMDHLARNSDGDELLFIHDGEGDLFCDWGHLAYRDGDYIVLPRGGMWRIEPKAATTMLLLEATEGSYQLPEKGLLGPQAIFDPAILDTPRMDHDFRQQQTAIGESGACARDGESIRQGRQIHADRQPGGVRGVIGGDGEGARVHDDLALFPA